MKKKGKSNEDKKLILYDIMLESESFFILKELEALAPKKGIRSIFVKDLIQQLIDDNKIKSEKVGSQNVFWILKTEESSILQNKYQELKDKKEEYEEMAKAEKETYAELESSLSLKNDKLKDTLKEVKNVLDRIDIKKSELDKLKKTDIRQIEKMKIQSNFATESIERWNNNIFLLKQWIQDRTKNSGDTVDRLLGIKDIFDNWN
ncbi:meiotic nuclear division protein 1, putative [Plasmodium berghei]|uniref:Meiotic nuclear division protein 1, putative n=2 Tax=Plasmodium berghei TaxID=5821 RepID=A0A509ASF5_PLABA|nr:meiotic nuclear division protein 1, putative [Plasmodium berghei ANKA]CXI94348.1 meiotic nuclear division protein 1, putative [Plasmodium berghei]SCL96991.1 meiotic nuclear division protein 1, putative [Plasmodium berghei]SCM16527.1 meiotic nuclear division protein 1, putative [Plasmodium berghei]SCM18321.1 meiotic nuclear division protein 1, putative [Plasmodium berghei]SCN27751.1 meiotic nuclear division protein 1, putative [Plasmodium berghei]|eukprot:XP_034423404.1 meiotic nuclear division protein 1, putative [Plasmodium berghei ANKA]